MGELAYGYRAHLVRQEWWQDRSETGHHDTAKRQAARPAENSASTWPCLLAEKVEQKRAAATAAMVIPSTAIARPEVHLESYVLSDDDGPEKHSQNDTHELD